MRYVLKNKDKEVLCFETRVKVVEVAGSNIKKYEESIEKIKIIDNALLPFGLEINALDTSLTAWIRRRKAPNNRENVEKIIATYSHKNEKLMDYVNISLALSLNDSYWIIHADSAYQWKDVNLYDNAFEKALELAAFGLLSKKLSGITTSPEYTTNGMLKKCWHRDNGQIYLYKGSSKMYQGQREAYSEYYTAQIASVMEFNYVPYDLQEFHKQIVSTCHIFTNENEGYMPMAYCLDSQKRTLKGNDLLNEIINIYDIEALQDVMLFDALIYNTDRHLGNFGMIIDNNTNKLLRPAPIFDNGLSLITTLEEQDLAHIDLAMKNITSFFDIAFDEQMLYYTQERHLKNLHKLSTFEFIKHPTFNLPPLWLEPINKHIQERAKYAIRLYESKM